MSIKIPKYPYLDNYYHNYTFRALAQDADEKKMEGVTQKAPNWVFASMTRDGRLQFEAEHVIPKTIGRYIGSRDKNGKSLYDGDIVWVEFPGSLREELPAEFSDKTLQAVGVITDTTIQLLNGPFFWHGEIPDPSIEVLGNIYEGRPLDRAPFPVLEKHEVCERLRAGGSLADIFPITLGYNNCMIKAPQFRLDDTVIYIPSINKYSIRAFDSELPSEWIDVIAGHLAEQEHKSIAEWEEGLKLIYYKRGLSRGEISMIYGHLITGNDLLEYMKGSEGLARALFYQCSSPSLDYYMQGRAEDIAWLDCEYEWDE